MDFVQKQVALSSIVVFILSCKEIYVFYVTPDENQNKIFYK